MQFFRNKSPKQVFLIGALLIAVIVTPLVAISLPTVEDQLEDSRWCISQLYIEGKPVQAVTYGMSIQYGDDCNGSLTFSGNVVSFPGVNSYAGDARWTIEGDKILIDGADENAKIFAGSYTVSCEKNVLRMESEKVKIVAKRFELNLPF